jgi:ATP-binding cassette subfamily B protein
MNEIFSRIHLNVRHIAAVAAFLVVAAVTQMCIPSLLSVMIDKGVGGGGAGMVVGIAVAMVALAAVSCGTSVAAARIAAAVTTKFSADLRRELFVRVQGFSAAEIDKFGTASLITRNTTDVTTIQTFLTQLLGLGLLAPVTAVAGLVLSVAFAGKVAVVIAIAVPVLIVAAGAIIFGASRYSIRLRGKIDDINRLFLETLEGVRVIRAFNRQEHEMARFGETNAETAKISRNATALSGLMLPTVNLLFGLASVGAMAVGTALVVHGGMDVGALVAATQYITMILLSIIMMSQVVSLFPDAWACAKRIGEVLATEPSIRDPSKPTPPKTGRGTVEFRNVTFAYPGADEAVLKGISFASGPGETTAIIGRTGCGKSSVVKLVPRLYDTLFGEVLVDGVNVRDYKLEELRGLVGYVPQKNVLFTGDIADNLNFGDEAGAEADWKEACRIACAAEFVERKDGAYHAAVAQGGTNFSGGQRQRLAIARAVMKKPEIYVFDDSFSALDMKTDRQVRQNLKESMGDATMIVVAQRVNTIRDATRILVLENGAVAGMGTHLELLKTCKLYREIAEIQLGEKEVAAELAGGM